MYSTGGPGISQAEPKGKGQPAKGSAVCRGAAEGKTGPSVQVTEEETGQQVAPTSPVAPIGSYYAPGAGAVGQGRWWRAPGQWGSGTCFTAGSREQGRHPSCQLLCGLGSAPISPSGPRSLWKCPSPALRPSQARATCLWPLQVAHSSSCGGGSPVSHIQPPAPAEHTLVAPTAPGRCTGATCTPSGPVTSAPP